MNFNYKNFLPVIANLTVVLILYTFLRFFFYFSNQNYFAEFSLLPLAEAFLLGIRFDIATVALTNSLYFILGVLPFYFVLHKNYQMLLKFIFVAVNGTFIAINFCDAEYFKFTGARLTKSVATQQSDFMNQLDQFVVNYWYIVLFCLLTFYLLKKIYLVQTKTQPPKSYVISLALLLLFFVSFFISARGGLQKKVLTPSFAFTKVDQKRALLALNSAFTFIKTHTKDHIEVMSFFNTLEEAKILLRERRAATAHTTASTPHMTNDVLNNKKSNVVLLILESFATEFWGIANHGAGYTPFLDELAKNGLFFRNSFANGRKSIEAVPSLLLGFPSLMEHPLAKSKFQFNHWNGIGSILEKNGYQTYFFHGADTGSMHFDAVASLAGIKTYSGRENYPNPNDYDGHWGVFDEPYLSFVADQLNQSQKPFFATVFTLSSHQPYPMPPQHKGRFKQGPTPLHESVGYVDHSLQMFFEKIKNQEWAKNTLFIITGDHTQMSPSINYDTEFGRYMVPLLFFNFQNNLRANTAKTVHHADVLPSILDYLQIKNEKQLLFGESVFKSSKGRALFHNNGIYYLIAGEVAVSYNSNTTTLQHFKFDKNDPNQALKVPANEISLDLENEIKAYIQYFNNGLNENNLY